MAETEAPTPKKWRTEATERIYGRLLAMPGSWDPATERKAPGALMLAMRHLHANAADPCPESPCERAALSAALLELCSAPADIEEEESLDAAIALAVEGAADSAQELLRRLNEALVLVDANIECQARLASSETERLGRKIGSVAADDALASDGRRRSVAARVREDLDAQRRQAQKVSAEIQRVAQVELAPLSPVERERLARRGRGRPRDGLRTAVVQQLRKGGLTPTEIASLVDFDAGDGADRVRKVARREAADMTSFELPMRARLPR